MIREGAVMALRAALLVTSQRETKEKEKPHWYRVSRVLTIDDKGCHGTGKTGNLKVHFSRQGKDREFAKKNMFLHGEFTTNTGKILEVKKIINL